MDLLFELDPWPARSEVSILELLVSRYKAAVIAHGRRAWAIFD